jgi:hypothetical protein
VGVFRNVVVPFVFLALMIAGFINTYGDSVDVEKLAARTACGGSPCEVQMTEFSRSPFSHEYVYVVAKNTRVTVKCARGAIFFGAYECERK